MDVLGVEFAPHVVILARSWNKVPLLGLCCALVIPSAYG